MNIEFRSRPQDHAAVGRRNRVLASEAGERDLADAMRFVMSRLVISTMVRAFVMPLQVAAWAGSTKNNKHEAGTSNRGSRRRETEARVPESLVSWACPARRQRDGMIIV